MYNVCGGAFDVGRGGGVSMDGRSSTIGVKCRGQRSNVEVKRQPI